jgi:murein DD-endopeptidase MepM/ murein hydrolase activator NlpD
MKIRSAIFSFLSILSLLFSSFQPVLAKLDIRQKSGPDDPPMITTSILASGYKLPYPGGVTYKVGRSFDQHNNAVDFGLPVNSMVVAARGGVVKEVKQSNTAYACNSNYAVYNNQIVIYHPDTNLYDYYLHIATNSAMVSVGQTILQGQPIAKSGQIGYTCGAHLHFAVYSGSTRQYLTFDDVGSLASNTSYTSGNYYPPGPKLQFEGNVSSRLFFDNGSDRINLEVCADNLAGNVVYSKLWRSERWWEYTTAASGRCVTVWDMDGAGGVFTDRPYRAWASLNSAPDTNWPVNCYYGISNRYGLCTQAQYNGVSLDPSSIIPNQTIVSKNGTLDQAFSYWWNWNADYVVSNGVLYFKKPASSAGASLGQTYEFTVPAYTPLEASVDLGNVSGVTKHITLVLRSKDTWTGAFSCGFDILAGRPLENYIIQGKAPASWTALTIEVIPDPADGIPDLILDNLAVQRRDDLSGLTTVVCKSPNKAPNAPGATAPANGGSVVAKPVTLQVSDGGDPDNLPQAFRSYQYHVEQVGGAWTFASDWINETSLTVPVPANGAFRWWAIASDGALSGPSSAINTFTYQQEVPCYSFKIGVAFESRPAKPDISWENEIALSIYPAGSPTAVKTATATTDANGEYLFSCLPAGSYDFRVKSGTSLQKKVTTSITSQTTLVDMGTLFEGDANNDDLVNLLDFNILASSFGKNAGNIGYNPHADFNRDTFVNIADFKAMASNFSKAGSAANLTSLASLELAGANMALSPSAISVAPTERFTVNVDIQASASPVDGAEAHLNFDPAVLKVVSITPATSLPLVIQNTFDNTIGTIDYAAGALNNQPSGNFNLLQVTFEAKTTSAGTSITFNKTNPRSSSVIAAGVMGIGTTTNSTVVIQTIANFTISGWVKDNSGVAIVGAQVSSSNGKSVTSGQDGSYALNQFTSGSYTLTVSKNGFVFTPSSIPVSVVSGNLTGQNFTGKNIMPVVIEVTPDHVAGNVISPITLNGVNFSTGATVYIGTTSVTPKTTVANSITATVPASLPTGTYDVRVCNPDSFCSTLPAALTVTQDQPILKNINPAQGVIDIPNRVIVYGYNFQAGLQARLNEYPLTGVELGENLFSADVPAGMPIGTYNLYVKNPGNLSEAALENAYSVLPTLIGDDFFTSSAYIWTSPSNVYQGDTVDLGLNVYRKGGKQTLEVKVDFYLGNPDAGGQLIGSTLTPPILPGPNMADAAFVEWNTKAITGTVEIFAVIDSGNEILEGNESNNRASRMITILPAPPDRTPPVITSVVANQGKGMTTIQDVEIKIAAEDRGGSLINKMRLVEYMYNSSAGTWVRSNNLDWIPYQATYTMHLSNRAGVRYIQVWVSDGDGNRSINMYKVRLDFNPPSESVSFGEVKVYRQSLTATTVTKQQFTVKLEIISGDADLYIWSEDKNLSWASNRDGTLTDEKTFDVPNTGTYQIEVYGYQESRYILTYGVVSTKPPSAEIASETSELQHLTAEVKNPRIEPAIEITNEPAGVSAVPNPPVSVTYRIYAPLLQR